MLTNSSQEFIQKETTKPAVNLISVGITWVDGRCLFKLNTKWSRIWFGICNFSENIWAISPLDYPYPTMITTISVSPTERYCERAYTCLHFNCNLNKFNKNVFLTEFKDCGALTLGLPLDLGSRPLWFNEGKYSWNKLVISPEGGRMDYSEEKLNANYKSLGSA